MKKANLKDEYFRLLDSGMKQSEIAIKLHISTNTASKWKLQREKPLKELEQTKANLLERLSKVSANPNSTDEALYYLSVSVGIIEEQIQAKKVQNS